jgi:predicted TIM-barrel fold metal-dependent hydrolase
VLYDVMGEVSICELLADEYSDVNFIIPHLGSFSDDWRAQHAFIDYLARHPNIYTDTSGVRRYDLLVKAVKRAGAHKVLFGSDGPWLHPGIELFKVRALHLPPRFERLVLGETFLQLIARVRAIGNQPEQQYQTLDKMAQPPISGITQEMADPWLHAAVMLE